MVGTRACIVALDDLEPRLAQIVLEAFWRESVVMALAVGVAESKDIAEQVRLVQALGGRDREIVLEVEVKVGAADGERAARGQNSPPLFEGGFLFRRKEMLDHVGAVDFSDGVVIVWQVVRWCDDIGVRGIEIDREVARDFAGTRADIELGCVSHEALLLFQFCAKVIITPRPIIISATACLCRNIDSS
jgi:hypothetical protein